MMMNIHDKILSLLLVGCIVFLASCKKLIQVDSPKNQLITATIFEDDLTAVAAISGLFSRTTSSAGSLTSVTYLAALSADEATITQSPEHEQFMNNAIFDVNSVVQTLWQTTYTHIYLCNSIIEGLEKSDKITPTLKSQLLGEAKFMRAFNHFYLVNLFGDVPYIKTTDYRSNGLLKRMPVTEVYGNIVADLLEAKAVLSHDYSYSKGERVRPNRWVATALLSRVYLYLGDWAKTEEQASLIIGNSLFSLNQNFADVFLKNSRETIWQLMPIGGQKYTNEGSLFNQANNAGAYPVMSPKLSQAFETEDGRLREWVGSANSGNRSWHYSLKYKEIQSTGTGKEYATVFRLAEQYLIRAESRAMMNMLTGANSAASDINVIRNRAGLEDTQASTKEEFLLAIEHERRVELFNEWGHRWLDLKRIKRATAVLGNKPDWTETDELYPIPQSELLLNPNLTQNNGY